MGGLLVVFTLAKLGFDPALGELLHLRLRLRHSPTTGPHAHRSLSHMPHMVRLLQCCADRPLMVQCAVRHAARCKHHTALGAVQAK